MSYVDRAPVGQTCPEIDQTINTLELVEREIADKYIQIKKYMDIVINAMEKIRQDNASLREWGNKAYELLEESESARQEALKQCDILEQQLEKAVAELQELKEENDDITKRYWQLEDKYLRI
ncbi:MAG: hypothetical protein ABFD00_06515 [Chloroherpetonaceae bacterium]